MTAALKAVEAASPVAMTVLVIATLVLLAAIVVHRTILRSAAVRHAVVLMALLTIGLCPLIVIAARLAGTARFTFSPNPILSESFLRRSPSAASLPSGSRDVSSRRIPLAGILLVLWAAGTMVSLTR